MSTLQAYRNATVFDSLQGVLRPNTTLVIDKDRFVEVTQEAINLGDMPCTDLQGAVVLPGLIDAHVHVTAVHHNVLMSAMQPPSLITAQSKDILEGMLARGFTSVRDAAGADFGLQEAVARGLFAGPRLYIAGYPITQTGGHADIRPKGAQTMFCTCAGLGLFGAIADGVGPVRKAVREQIRNGANQIKLMAGGGVASPTDPIDGTQFSLEELAAACEEAAAANLYAMAHAYSPRAIIRAVQSGVRSIEHGNLLDEASAREMKKAGAFLVPTLATYAALAADADKLGMPEGFLPKLDRVQHKGLDAIRLAKSEGVPIAFGTDLLGQMHAQQSQEWLLRAAALTPIDILQSATSIAARMMQQEGQIGVIAPGALADMVVMRGDPTTDISLLARPDESIRLIVQGGRVVRRAG